MTMRYQDRMTTLYSIMSNDWVYLYSVPRHKGIVLFQSIGYDAFQNHYQARLTRSEAVEEFRLWRQHGAKIVNVSRAMYK